MKPLKFLFAAMALALFIVSIPASTAEPAPVLSTSEYSVYRAWDVVHWSGSYAEDPYYLDESLILQNVITVDGGLMVNSIDGPFPNDYNTLHATGFYTTADYDVCWLDESLTKQSIHVDEANLENTGGQANSNGHIWKTLYQPGYFEVPEYARMGAWLEDITISQTRYNSGTSEYDKVCTYHLSAGYCENIYLMAEYSIGAPAYALSDPWDHPSCTKSIWNAVEWSDTWRAPKSSFYADSLEYDWSRNELILESRAADGIANRSALYGYAEALRSRMVSVYYWQSSISPTNGAASLNTGRGHINAALYDILTIQTAIQNGAAMGTIRADLTRAVTDYHLAILYTDKAIVQDYDREPVGGDYTPEEWRELYISLYIAPYIQDLEPRGDGVAGYLGTDLGLVLTGVVAALGLVAALMRSPFAALLGVLLAIADVLLFLWYDLGWSP